MFMALLLSSTFFFKRFISPNFFGTQNLRFTHIDKKKQKLMFSSNFSIHKRKKFSKDVNKNYILTKILILNSGKKYRVAMYLANRPAGGGGGGAGAAHWKKTCYMVGDEGKRRRGQETTEML